MMARHEPAVAALGDPRYGYHGPAASTAARHHFPAAGADVGGCWRSTRAAVSVIVRKMGSEIKPTENAMSTMTGTLVISSPISM
jgi:hypothetical protein